MKNILLLFVVISSLFSNSIKAQISLETFFFQTRRFVAADYSRRDLLVLKKWSDSSYSRDDNKKSIRQIWFRGKMKTKEGAQIQFSFGSSELKGTNEKLVGGTFFISNDGGCNAALLMSVLGYLPKYYMSFDTIKVERGIECSCKEIRLHFYNYNPSTNKVLESIDTSIVKLIKKEYFDFYFTDLNKKTSKWQTEFKNFMQPYSNGLIALVNKGNIKDVFDIIGLNNKGYGWFLAEGLWYYNSIHSCLTSDQLKVLDAYNGKNGTLSFRPVEELKCIYKF